MTTDNSEPDGIIPTRKGYGIRLWVQFQFGVNCPPVRGQKSHSYTVKWSMTLLVAGMKRLCFLD